MRNVNLAIINYECLTVATTYELGELYALLSNLVCAG